MSYKTTDGLMRHLRDNGIAISGTAQKRQLINANSESIQVMYDKVVSGYRNAPASYTPVIQIDNCCISIFTH